MPQDRGAVAPAPVRRLTQRWQFLACARGRSLARGAVAVQAVARPDGSPAIGVGFTATKRIGGAVVRNRAKRRLREAARLMLPLYGEAAHDYVFLARDGTAERPWLRLLDDVKSALIGLAAGGHDPRPTRAASAASKPSRSSKTARPSPPPAPDAAPTR